MVAQTCYAAKRREPAPRPAAFHGDQPSVMADTFVLPALPRAFFRGAQGVVPAEPPGRLRNDCAGTFMAALVGRRRDMDARAYRHRVGPGEGQLPLSVSAAAGPAPPPASPLLRTREDHADVRRPARFADRSDLVAGHSLCVVAGRRPFDFIRAPCRTRRSPGRPADAGADRRRAQHAAQTQARAKPISCRCRARNPARSPRRRCKTATARPIPRLRRSRSRRRTGRAEARIDRLLRFPRAALSGRRKSRTRGAVRRRIRRLRSTTSAPTSFICRTVRRSRRIPATANGSTIRNPSRARIAA